MRICVIGAGSTGRGLAAYLASKGVDCRLNTRSEDKARCINEKGITAEGDVSGRFMVPVYTDLGEAVAGADYIVVMTVANAHREVAQRLKGLLAHGQRILIFNSNWGALQFMQVLGEDIEKKALIVAETSAQLFVGIAKDPATAKVRIKEQVAVSATDPRRTAQLMDELGDIFPQLVKAESIVDTTMSSTNPVIHVPITLLNLVRVENKQHFMFYGEGVSRAAVKMILAIDAERIAVASGLGCQISDVLTGINSFWTIKHANLFDALTKNEGYLTAVGPTELDHRFLSEDVPYGIAPIAKLGRLLGIPTPHTDALLEVLSHLLGDRLVQEGVSFTQEDLMSLR